MTIPDGYGNALTTGSDRARDCLDAGLRLLLEANHGAADMLRQAIASDPDFVAGHTGLARALMMEGDMPGARQAIVQAGALAERQAGRISAREGSQVAALALLLSGQPAEARRAVLEHVRSWPRDALVAQLCTNIFGLIGFSGEVGREAALLAYTGMLLPHYGDDWWMMSMHALSLCETGQTRVSQDLMERSLGINPRNANGAHFKAHAHYEAGETGTGRAYLSEWIETYDPRAVLHGHLSWHAALWALQAGDAESMWRAVDGAIAPGATQSLPINVLTDTAALYHRAELSGMAVPVARWQQLSDYAARHFPATGQSFADVHAALSHAMAGQGERLARIAEGAQGFAGDLVRPVARAWGAIARADWHAAIDELVPVMGQTERLGGSRAQRDLIELTYVNALLRAGQREEAQRTLATRRPHLARPVPLAALDA